MISDSAFRVLIGCWLLASEDDKNEGRLPDTETVAFRLRISKSKASNALQELKNILYQDDITMISDGYQHDAPETETETEVEREKETKKETDPLLAEALELSKELIHMVSQATGRKLVSTPAAGQKHILKLLKNDITPELVRLTIHWLCTDNLANDFKFEVQSGKSLYEKWDRIAEMATA